MTTDQLLEILADRGVTLTRRGSDLKYYGPEDAITPALLQVLRLHKPRLLERLPDSRCVYIGIHWPGCSEPYKLVPADEYFAVMEHLAN